MGNKVMIIEFNDTGDFIRQPDIGAITGTTKVSVTWDDAWTGHEDCLKLINGNVVFNLNANYVNNRLEAYAPLAEQLDMQYHDTMNGTKTWLDHINSVKTKYPKEAE
jgi:hypothetical protein